MFTHDSRPTTTTVSATEFITLSRTRADRIISFEEVCESNNCPPTEKRFKMLMRGDSPIDSTNLLSVFVLLLSLFTAISSYYFGTLASTAREEENSQLVEDATNRLIEASGETRAAWELARVTLEKHFNRNLSQTNSIYYLSLCVMLIGFGVLIAGLIQSTNSDRGPLRTYIPIAAGVIIQFIGATFLVLYKSMSQQTVNYTNLLARINTVGMALQIIETLPEKSSPGDHKSRAKILVVELMLREKSRSSPSKSKPPARGRRSGTPKAEAM
jgi:hypothetical protein